jgi:hypothetical protein
MRTARSGFFRRGYGLKRVDLSDRPRLSAGSASPAALDDGNLACAPRKLPAFSFHLRNPPPAPIAEKTRAAITDARQLRTRVADRMQQRLVYLDP